MGRAKLQGVFEDDACLATATFMRGLCPHFDSEVGGTEGESHPDPSR